MNEQHLKKFTKEEREEIEELALATKRIFSGADGQKLLDFWMNKYVYQTAQPTQSEALIRTNAGKAAFVLGIVESIKIADSLRG